MSEKTRAPSSDGRKARAEYLRQWRKNHPEKCRQYADDYWNRRAEKEKMDRKHKQIMEES